MTYFHYTSDLHLDMQKHGHEPHVWAKILETTKPNTTRHYLILAGDIAQLTWKYYKDFLVFCSKHWKKVFLVPGNHEFYETSIPAGRAKLAEFESENIHVLMNHVYHVNEMVSEAPSPASTIPLLGCILWSHIPPLVSTECRQFLNDFENIDKFTPKMYNFFHEQDRKWLENEISENKKLSPGKPLLVVTHHAPLMKGTSQPKYEIPYRETNHCFSTDLRTTIDTLPQDSVWIFGHTHHRTLFKHNDQITICTNALGYSREDQEFPERFKMQHIVM